MHCRGVLTPQERERRRGKRGGGYAHAQWVVDTVAKTKE